MEGWLQTQAGGWVGGELLAQTVSELQMTLVQMRFQARVEKEPQAGVWILVEERLWVLNEILIGSQGLVLLCLYLVGVFWSIEAVSRVLVGPRVCCCLWVGNERMW